MSHHVNLYAVREGHGGGLGGKSYEILATRGDMEKLALKVLAGLKAFDANELPVQRMCREQGLALEGAPVPVLSEYATIPHVRTDRVAIQFFVISSLAEFHEMRPHGKRSIALSVAQLAVAAFALFGLVVVIRWLVQLL